MNNVNRITTSNEQFYSNNISTTINNSQVYVDLINQGNFMAKIEIIYFSSSSQNKVEKNQIVPANKTKRIKIPNDASDIYVSIQYYNSLNTWVEVKYKTCNTPINVCFKIYGDISSVNCDEVDCSTENNSNAVDNNISTVSNDATGYISVTNSSSFSARLTISYRIPGQTFKKSETITISSKKNGQINYPTSSYDINIKIEASSLLSSWKIIYNKSFNYFDNRCFKVSGGVLSSATAEVISCNSTAPLLNSIDNNNSVNSGTVVANPTNGYVNVDNSSTFIVKLSISYRVPGKTFRTFEKIKISTMKSGQINFPVGAYNFDVKIEVSSLTSSWRTVYNKGFNNLINKCFKVSGILLTSVTVKEVSCNMADSNNTLVGISGTNSNSNDGYIQLNNKGVFVARLYIRYQVSGYIGALEQTLTLASTQTKQITFPAETTNVYVEFQVANALAKFSKVDYRQYSYVVKKCFTISGTLVNAKVLEVSCS